MCPERVKELCQKGRRAASLAWIECLVTEGITGASRVPKSRGSLQGRKVRGAPLSRGGAGQIRDGIPGYR